MPTVAVTRSTLASQNKLEVLLQHKYPQTTTLPYTLCHMSSSAKSQPMQPHHLIQHCLHFSQRLWLQPFYHILTTNLVTL